jgi:protein-L-isoaspartate(D-aspartate) O-methyltransferase
VPEPPPALCGQLADRGRLCTVVRAGAGAGKAMQFVNAGGIVSRREMFDANTPMLPGFATRQEFVF